MTDSDSRKSQSLSAWNGPAADDNGGEGEPWRLRRVAVSRRQPGQGQMQQGPSADGADAGQEPVAAPKAPQPEAHPAAPPGLPGAADPPPPAPVPAPDRREVPAPPAAPDWTARSLQADRAALMSIGRLGQMAPAGTGEAPFHILEIIGQVEGHVILPPKNKTTKYEHVVPQILAVEQNPAVQGLLIVLNTVGGDIEAGLAIAELIKTMSKPTVSLVLGGGHSIGVPIAVASDYSFIAETATMTIHPIRLSGMLIGVPQTFEYLDKMQDRVIRFIVENSRISEKRVRELMFRTGELVRDMGTVLVGREAVDEGLIDAVGGVADALAKLQELARERAQAPRPPLAAQAPTPAQAGPEGQATSKAQDGAAGTGGAQQGKPTDSAPGAGRSGQPEAASPPPPGPPQPSEPHASTGPTTAPAGSSPSQADQSKGARPGAPGAGPALMAAKGTGGTGPYSGQQAFRGLPWRPGRPMYRLGGPARRRGARSRPLAQRIGQAVAQSLWDFLRSGGGAPGAGSGAGGGGQATGAQGGKAGAVHNLSH